MAVQKLDRVIWPEFCRVVSQRFASESHEIEILATYECMDIDGQWLRAVSIDCDADSAVLELASEFAHLTLCPHELYADWSERGLEGLCILDREYGWHVVLLRHPLQLGQAKLTASRVEFPPPMCRSAFQ
jgi:hypothetical protein